MSLYLLDTDTLTLFIQGHQKVGARLLSVKPSEIAISVITVEEHLSGWYTFLRKAQAPDRISLAYGRLASAVSWLNCFPILSLSVAAYQRSQQLLSLKLNVAKMDLRIAAIALEEGATVVTRNLRDFQRVPQLSVEDWSV